VCLMRVRCQVTSSPRSGSVSSGSRDPQSNKELLLTRWACVVRSCSAGTSQLRVGILLAQQNSDPLDRPTRGMILRPYVLALAIVACGSPAPGERVGATWQDPVTGMEFVRVPAGEFVMGLREGESDVRNAPSHGVRLTRSFYLGRFEVTQAQWHRVMGTDPSQLSECGPDCPVESVSWHEVRDFLERLTELNPGERFRLPTEAEWEYVCRAGGEARYGETDTLDPTLANYDSRIPFDGVADTVFMGSSARVGSYSANVLGLHDLLGNVWEWTEDEYCPYSDSSVIDPVQHCGSDTIPIRGGSWYFSAGAARCGRRYTHAREDSGFSLGFRVLRESPAGGGTV
jgi:formylglycine-generating enzyme required for sulfatase activity